MYSQHSTPTRLLTGLFCTCRCRYTSYPLNLKSKMIRQFLLWGFMVTYRHHLQSQDVTVGRTSTWAHAPGLELNKYGNTPTSSDSDFQANCSAQWDAVHSCFVAFFCNSVCKSCQLYSPQRWQGTQTHIHVKDPVIIHLPVSVATI